MLVDSPGYLSINTPLQLEHWVSALEHHPDNELRAYLLKGIENGFKVGFDYAHPLTTSARNMTSAINHPSVVHEYLDKECVEGRVLGSMPTATAANIQINSFGVIPKKHQENKWRLILDLSSPTHASVNDGINPDFCSLKYT